MVVAGEPWGLRYLIFRMEDLIVCFGLTEWSCGEGLMTQERENLRGISQVHGDRMGTLGEGLGYWRQGGWERGPWSWAVCVQILALPLTGSGIRTTKAKKIVNSLKNSRCTQFIKTEHKQGARKETHGWWNSLTGYFTESEKVTAHFSSELLMPLKSRNS